MIPVVVCMFAGAGMYACGGGTGEGAKAAGTEESANAGGGQASVNDDVSQKDIVKVASDSKDHTTLVAAVKAADLVNSLANAGPFTVFAPVNAVLTLCPKAQLKTC